MSRALAFRVLSRCPAPPVELQAAALFAYVARLKPGVLECGRGDRRTEKGKRKAQSNGVRRAVHAVQHSRVYAGKCRPKSDAARPKLPTLQEQPERPAPPL